MVIGPHKSIRSDLYEADEALYESYENIEKGTNHPSRLKKNVTNLTKRPQNRGRFREDYDD